MIISSESVPLRRQLIRDMQKQGMLHEHALVAAFDAIPREMFVPLFYQKSGNEWESYSRDMRPDEWLHIVYQDEALVTLLNARGVPISSSSQPSIMAAMLSALAVKSGMHVLEIGTGTGYNAALLAYLTNNPAFVTTIDLDPNLVEQAANTLHTLVGPVKVLVGNGLDICLEESVDRIIATASIATIPKRWYEQLNTDGRLVLPLMGSLGASGLLTIEKQGEEGSGFFSPVPLAFMPIQEQGEERPMPSVRELFALPLNSSFSVEGEDEEAMISHLSDDLFRWFVQWIWPSGALSILSMTLSDGRQAFQIKDTQAPAILQLTYTSSGSWSGQQRGAFPLYQHLMKYYRLFEQLGRPEKHAYRVQIDEYQCLLSLQSTREPIILRELFS